jgi:NitT/TauT family transport system substrate-binding protein
MKIRSAIMAGIVVLASIGIIVSVIYQSGQSEQENKIRVAFFPTVSHLVPIVGMETGILADGLGNQILIEPKIFDSGPQVIEAMFANSVDLAYIGPGPVINGFLKSEKHDVKILAGAASGGASFVIHRDSIINSAADLSGKIIAAPQIGNTQDVSLRHYLSQNGLVPAEKGGSVVVLNIQNPDIYTLFVKGEIDAAWVPEHWATRLVQELGGKRLFFEEELWPEKQFASALLIGRTSYIEENPQIIQKWIDANNKTVIWINENPEDSELIFNHFMEKTLGKPLPESVLSESLANIQITSDPIEESISIFAERANSLGYLGRHGYDLDGIFYNTISKDDMS